MTTDERVQAVADYGFTERQARFLVLVMRHAGLCVKRQYAGFAGIANGGEKCNAFFDKLVSRGHAVAADCIHNRARLYHVHHRAALPRHRRARQPLPPAGTRAVGRRAADAARCGAHEPESRLAHHQTEKVAYLRARTRPSRRASADAATHDRRTSPTSFLGRSRSASIRAGTWCCCTSRPCRGRMTSGRSWWGTRRCSA